MISIAFAPLIILELIVLLLYRRKIDDFLPYRILFGSMSIIGGFAYLYFLQESKMNILMMVVLLSIGIFTMLPLKSFRSRFIRTISYLLSILVVIMVIFPKFSSQKSNLDVSDSLFFIAAPIYISVLFGLFCVPFLLIKSRKGKALHKNQE